MKKTKAPPFIIIMADTTVVDRKDWLRERKKAVCSSDYPMLVGLSNFGTAIDLYEDKIDPDKIESTIALRQKFRFDFGHAIEPVVLNVVAENIGAVGIIDKSMAESTLYPYMRNDCDGIFVMKSERVVQGVLFQKDAKILFECKTVNHAAFKECRLNPKPDHVAQTKHGMLVRGLEWGIIAYCKGNDLENDVVYHLVPLTKEDKKIIPLICEEFFEGNVIPLVPPTRALGPNASEFKKALIRYCTRSGELPVAVLRLPGHTQTLFEQGLAIQEELSALNAQVKAKEGERDKIHTEFIAMLGETYQKGVLDSIYQTYEANLSTSSSPKMSSDSMARLKEEKPELFEDLVKQGYITHSMRSTFKLKRIVKKSRTARK